MTVARSVSDVLDDHVVFEVECIDRMYLNVDVPGLHTRRGWSSTSHRQLGLPIASTAPMGKISDGFSAGMHRFARDQHVPWVDFAKGQRKDDVLHEHLARFTGEEGVLFIGRAQEKTNLFRTEKRRNADGERLPVDRGRPPAWSTTSTSTPSTPTSGRSSSSSAPTSPTPRSCAC